jgi:hypothetical protein
MKHGRKLRAPIAAMVCLAIVSVWLLGPTATGAPARTTATHASRFTNVPVTGTFGSGGTFSGVLDIKRFAASGGSVVAVGSLSGTAKNGTGTIVKSMINEPVRLPLTQAGSVASPQAAATCPILHLELGPLDLNLLGLVIHLNKVVLDITAQSGPGNLLGNLLCAIAHLLDNTGAPTLANLLTAILRALGIQQLLM